MTLEDVSTYLDIPPKTLRKWRLQGSLVPILAELADHATRALRLARLAHVASMKDQPVMRVLPELIRRELQPKQQANSRKP